MSKIIFLTLFMLLQNAMQAQIGNVDFLYQVGLADSLYSEILEEQRKIYVQIPESYSLNTHQKYPVIYVLDGEVFLPSVDAIHGFYSGGYIPEMVIVGVSNREHRTRDLTPTVIASRQEMPFNEEHGAAGEFHRFLENELIPFIENKYPVMNYRTLIGHSYGGLFTIYALINKSDLFENYLAIDPSLDWDNQILLDRAKPAFSSGNYRGKSLYVSLSGQLHMQNPEITIANVMADTSEFTLFARSNLAFKNLLMENNENGLNFEWEFFPKELHGTIALPSIKNGLIQIFEWFQMEHTEKFNTPETSKNELNGIVQHRGKKLQDHFKYKVPPYPEDLLNALGYMSLDIGQIEKSKMFFDFMIEYYPNSANSYDSMADYFERQEDYISALKFVTKAFEISDSNYHKQRIEKLNQKIREAKKRG